MAYQDSISQMATTYFANYWLMYDRQFRLKRANNQFLPWDMEDPDLFIAYLRTAPVLASAALPVSSAHSTSAGASAVTKTTTTGAPSPRPNSGKCCYNCQGYGHIAQSCNYAPVPHPPNPPPVMTSYSTGTQAVHVPAAPTNNDNTAAQPFRAPQRNPVRQSQPSGFCPEWNSSGQPCHRGCAKDHRCSWCTHLHPRRNCPTYPGNHIPGQQP